MDMEERFARIEEAIDRLDGKAEGAIRAAYIIAAALKVRGGDEVRDALMDGLEAAEKLARTTNEHAETIEVLRRVLAGLRGGKLARPSGKPR